MATTTATKRTAAELRPVDDAPEVRAAQSRVEPLAQRFSALAARLTRFAALLDPHFRQHLATPPSEAETLEAIEHVTATRVEHARVRRELRDAEHDLAQARAAERARLRAIVVSRKRELVTRLDAALTAAASVNVEIADLEQQERDMLGAYVDPLMWGELLPETPTVQSRLDLWRRTAREQQLIAE